MDLYLPDDFYRLSGTRKDRADLTPSLDDDMAWLGGETQVTPFGDDARKERAEPDPMWHAI